jgi:Xaa-Pro aminopeptidase
MRHVDFESLAVGPPPQLPVSTFARRRRTLAKRLGDGNTLVVATNPSQQFSNDVDFNFRPHSDFWYLTGFSEPGAVLALEGGSGRSTLFLRDRKNEEEIWTGRRLGVKRAADALHVDRALAIADLTKRLPKIVGRDRVHSIAEHDPAAHRRIVRMAGRKLLRSSEDGRPGGRRGVGGAKRAQRQRQRHARDLIADLRLRKSDEELKMLQAACDLGVAAHKFAAGSIQPGAREFETEAAFAFHSRRHGSTGVGYPSICGAGENGAVLHYVSNLAKLRRRQLFLIDAGCEWGYYTSDITRTYPVGGTFTRLQLKLYELVLEAHRAAMRKVKPGVPFRAPHEAAVEVLAGGLVEMGFLPGRIEKAIASQSYRRFFMHGTSHWLGLDVHDVGSLVDAEDKPRLLQEGNVLTIEPGLYFNPDFSKCPPGTSGIGIRIEDDVAVADGGRLNMTRRLPVAPEAVAALL